MNVWHAALCARGKVRNDASDAVSKYITSIYLASDGSICVGINSYFAMWRRTTQHACVAVSYGIFN